jgi:hypothetical protein
MAPPSLRRTRPAKNCIPAQRPWVGGRDAKPNWRSSAPARSAPLRAAPVVAVSRPHGTGPAVKAATALDRRRFLPLQKPALYFHRKSPQQPPNQQQFLPKCPGNAQQSGTRGKRSRGKCVQHPGYPARVVMREPGSSTAGAGRRDDGAVGDNPTDSHDPRHHEQEGRAALLFVPAFFSYTGRGAEGELPRRDKRSPSGGFSFAAAKENGGRIPAGKLRPRNGVLTSAPAPWPPRRPLRQTGTGRRP